MQPAPPGASTCSNCGGVLEETPGGGLGCMSCLLRAGIGSQEETTQDSTSNTLENGGRFGVYEIDCHPGGGLYELGRGSMGVTYRATDTSLQRKVALKIIKTDIAERTADARERFMREARAAAALRHENIATVYQFGMRLETGQYFYAMELIEGENLEERVRRAGPLDARITIGIAQQVTSALAAAEKHGLVHRDLKPANLMLVNADDPKTMKSDQAPSNRNRIHALRKGGIPGVKIIDFGLAKAFHTATDLKSLTHGRFVGTPAFASPEQFEHSALDVRSDIYSLGETLWFALTGKTPFGGRSVGEIHRAQQSNVLPVKQLKAAHVPSRLRSLLESMLALEPASRPGTQELAARLQRCSPEARSVRRTRVAFAAAALVVLGTSTLFVFQRLWIQNAPLNSALEKSIAVLPFENRSDDKDNAYFADGIQDEILTRLSKIADLKVISRTSTLQYQSNPANLREIAKQLGVANILEGSVQKVAGQVRVNVQLINAQTDSHLWANTFDHKLTDIFRLESEIAKGIAESLQAKLTGREEQALALKPTDNLEAYDAYLHGLALESGVGYTFDSLPKIIDFYERAVQLDPSFAPAWRRLSCANAYCYSLGENGPIRATSPAGGAAAAYRDAARKALENAQKLEPDSPETLLVLGYYQFWVLRDFGLAKSTFRQVHKELQGSLVPRALGAISQIEGHWDESIAYMEQALVLDPLNPDILVDTAKAYAMLRQFPTALKLIDRALDILPNNADLVSVKAIIYQAQGNLQEATKLLLGVNAGTASSAVFFVKLRQLTFERNFGEAARLLQAQLAQFQNGPAKGGYQVCAVQVWLAALQRLAGDTAGAKATAEEALKTLAPIDERQPGNPNIVNVLSLAKAELGEKDSALKDAERAIMLVPSDKNPVDGPAFEESLAQIYALFGENGRAISILTRLLQTPYSSLTYRPLPITPAHLRLDPRWDPLRGDPAFQKLCQEKQP